MTMAIFDRMTAMLVGEHLYDLSAAVNEAAAVEAGRRLFDRHPV
jgi:hypothetical protein